MSNKISDEQVIERKLLIDGDGVGDDRRLNILLKSFLKWINSENVNSIENQRLKEKVEIHMDLCEMAMKKSRIVSRRIDEEMVLYNEESNEIDQNIAKTLNDIAVANEELKSAECIKRARMEYTSLANSIEKYPSREKSAEVLKAHNDEIHALKEKSSKLAQKLDSKRYKLQIIMNAINTLEDNSDDSEEEIMSNKEKVSTV